MVGLGYFLNQQPAVPAQIMAYATLRTIPALVAFAHFQGAFVRSIASSCVKG